MDVHRLASPAPPPKSLQTHGRAPNAGGMSTWALRSRRTLQALGLGASWSESSVRATSLAI